MKPPAEKPIPPTPTIENLLKENAMLKEQLMQKEDIILQIKNLTNE